MLAMIYFFAASRRHLMPRRRHAAIFDAATILFDTIITLFADIHFRLPILAPPLISRCHFIDAA